MTRTVIGFVAGLCGFLLGTPAAGSDGMDLSGLREVRLPATPPREEIVMLRPAWTLDGGDDPQAMLGVVHQAEAAADGTVLLVDESLGHVLLVGADGTCLGVRGRIGEGPGELRRILCAAPLADGRLVLSEGLPPQTYGMTLGRVVVLDAAGHPAGGFDFRDPAAAGNDWPTVRGVRAAGGRLLVGLFVNRVEPPQLTSINRLLLTDQDGKVVAVLGDHRTQHSFLDTELHEANSFEPYTLDRFDLAADGRVVCLPERDAYVVCVVDPATGAGLRLTADQAGRPRTEAERATLAELNSAPGLTFRVLPAEPVLEGVRFRPDGTVWVALGRRPGAAADEFGSFDEIDRDGAWRRRVHVRAPGEAAEDRLIPLRDGRFVLVRGLEAEDVGDEGISVILLGE